ncbi:MULTISPECIES: hypothetical protein [Falsihalocynthiibacter]|uniref:hypothetical protein n=1 Tax=Falsihalocynthiibacter TaxID=2854182 RepID=UPI00300210A7
MARRRYFRGLTLLTTVASLALVACGPTQTSPKKMAIAPTTTVSASSAEKQLQRQATAMQKTILEGAVAGALLAGALSSNRRGAISIGPAIGFGMVIGGSAGTYVAFLQKQYSNNEQRLDAVKSDIDANSAEIQQTINVMREVLAVQEAELKSVRARVNSGASPEALYAELADANANLLNMQLAIEGADRRQAELGQVRGLVLANNNTSLIDPDLAALAQQITSMKAIANDLENQL